MGTPEGRDIESTTGGGVSRQPPEYHPTVSLPPTYSAPASEVAANWYPDPYAPGVLRYWDGTEWTEHRHAATPTASATVINNISVPRGGDGGEVAVHLVLTLLTCGLWLPVWILIEIIKAVSR